MIEINELGTHESLIYFPNKRLKVKKVIKNSNSIFLYYSNKHCIIIMWIFQVFVAFLSFLR